MYRYGFFTLRLPLGSEIVQRGRPSSVPTSVVGLNSGRLPGLCVATVWPTCVRSPYLGARMDLAAERPGVTAMPSLAAGLPDAVSTASTADVAASTADLPRFVGGGVTRALAPLLWRLPR